MIITFCGHSKISEAITISEKLAEVLNGIFEKALADGLPLTFYCGGYGDFDLLAAEGVEKTRIEFPAVRCEKIFVTPYITPSYSERNARMKALYDDVLYPPLETTPYRLAIVKRNEWMVSQSDLVIAYVLYSWGGAARTLEYAEKRKKKIIRLDG